MRLLKKLFGFDSRTMSLQKEVTGGVTTFLTMSYILAVNPAVLSETGMDADALFTTTVLASVVATVMMAVYAKMPFALAPSMGVSAFFVYTIVMEMGYTWQFGLTAVFVEGIIFILLTMTGLRERIVDAMPYELRKAISPGIGLFIALIGLHNAGIIDGSEETMVTLANLHNPSVLLALFFAPLFVAIPKAATAPAMFIVGMMMMGDVVKLDFRNYSVAVPCFVCIVFMPFAYSISDGILLGVITWVAVSIFSGRTKELKRTTVMLAMLFVLKYVFL